MDKIYIFGDGSSVVQEAVEILTDCEILSEILTTNYDELKNFDFETVRDKKVFFAINYQYLNYLRSGYLYQSKVRKHNIASIVHPTALIDEGSKIGINCLISYSAHIKAKTIIHNNVFIGRASNIGVNVTINENSWVGNDSKISSDVTIGTHTVIGDKVTINSAIVGSFCELTKEGIYKETINDHTHFIEEAKNPIYFI
jgi:UDP-3-O-[3-hydroxymyristoyl] glucosamine N-acyltransferase